MRNFFGKIRNRVLVMALFCLFSAAGVLSLYLYTYALEDGWYGKEDYTFADTRMCRAYTQDALNFVYRNLTWLGNPRDTSLGGYGGDAFAYAIRDAVTDEVYTDTTTENSYYVADYPMEVFTNSGEYNCRLSGYVNLPVQPYEGCYREYYIFEHLFSLRSFFLPVGITLLLAAVIALSLVIAAVMREGKKGKYTPLGYIPFDVAVVGLFILTSILQNIFYSVLNYNIIDVLSQVGIYYERVRTVFVVWYIGLLCLVLANQAAAKAVLQKLLIYQIYLRVPIIVLKLAVLALHLGFVAIGAIYYQNGMIYMHRNLFGYLVVFDILVLPLIVLSSLEENRIRKASNALANGELSYKVNTQRLHMVWKELGSDLNSIGDGMARAVEDRLRSERMKTELITNVSHDLKTPLTSIINYIALLKENDLPEETRREYLEVLDRQSAKLKKLTEDVVEASKAASGVVKMTPELVNVVELLQQSVGEYSERLQEVGIEPVIHAPETETYIMADGRLLGRVLDNFITNILKYAQSGTRAYFDLQAGEKVIIQVKNTSRAPLDIPADELMERFVRGDSSRSTEGSGLGLSIARSFTELMGGEMELTLDGDFFKVELIFPAAQLPAAEEIKALAAAAT